MRSSFFLGSAALALALALIAPTLAQDIAFGDDTSTWANDGQCDDPRFEGEGAAAFRSPVDEARDASDCQSLFEAGQITLVTQDADAAATEAGDDAQAAAIESDDIDFGDDSGNWANDGECDDPRFGGALASHELADATDCRTAFEAGDVSLVQESPEQSDVAQGEIDFGDDSGTFANDDECDDPRFGGGLTSHELADATDCRTAYEAGEVTYQGGSDTSEPIDSAGIDFGDDSGNWANDGECDDPRFGGALDSHEMADATDCREAYEAGEVDLVEQSDPPTYPIVIGEIDFGNDDGTYANDDECDDPRFEGTGMGVQLDDHLMADATDCSTAYQAGTVTLVSEGSGDSGDFRINFGDDSASSAFDGVCDDPRFQGRGGAMELLDSNMLADASDCRAAYEAGTVTYDPRT